MTNGGHVRGEHFRQTLLEDRETRYTGGLYHLSQIHTAYNTNSIEGSELDLEQVRYIYETWTIFTDRTTETIRVDDVVETVNAFELFDEGDC